MIDSSGDDDVVYVPNYYNGTKISGDTEMKSNILTRSATQLVCEPEELYEALFYSSVVVY